MKSGAILLAGGQGSRLSGDVPKQFLRVGGKPILLWAAESLVGAGVFSVIVVVVSKELESQARGALTGLSSEVEIRFVPGGDSRNLSTCAGLAALPSDVAAVAIHDAARPFVDASVIRAAMRPVIAGEVDATDVVIPTADTIVELNVERTRVVSIPDRDRLRRGQTPQCFRRDLLELAYSGYLAQGDGRQSDDCTVLLRYVPVARIVPIQGSETNIKITHVEDLLVADALLRERRTPLGTDLKAPGVEIGPTVVVGGASGIGRAIAEQLHQAGCMVVVASRRSGLEITDTASRRDFTTRIWQQLPDLRNLVVTAGSLELGPLLEKSEISIRDDIDRNLTGPLLLARDFAASIENRPAANRSVTFFGSSSYSLGRPNTATYSGSKAALVAVTQALAEEWHGRLRVNIVVPERTRTPMRVRAFGIEPPESLLSPEAVAASTLELLASDVSGSIVTVRKGTSNSVRTQRVTVPRGDDG